MLRRVVSLHLGTVLTVILVAALLFLSGCGQKESERATAVGDKPTDSLVIELTAVDSLSVFDLLQRTHRVEFNRSAMGVFVTSIDSVENGGGYYWIYSVNDSAGQTAADRHITTPGDHVRWHYRKSQ